MAFNFAKSLQFPKELDFQKISTNISSTVQGSFKEISKDFNNNIQPLTKNALSFVKGGLDGAEISELPKDYVLLEAKVDALRNVYKRLLEVSATYEVESYDYPPNLKESFSDFSKSVTEKFQELSHAATTKEAEKILSKPGSSQFPKTLSHALAKAALQSRELLLEQSAKEKLLGEGAGEAEAEEDSFSKVLLTLAEHQQTIGNKRLEQDSLVINEFNAKIKELLDKIFKENLASRKQVENSRYRLDHIRYELKIAAEETDRLQKAEQKGELAAHEKYVEDLSNKLEAAEDDLVNNTVIAAESMQKFLNPAEAINLIKILTKVQLNYFRAAAKELEALLGEIDKAAEAVAEENEEEEEEAEEADE